MVAVELSWLKLVAVLAILSYIMLPWPCCDGDLDDVVRSMLCEMFANKYTMLLRRTILLFLDDAADQISECRR